MPMAVTPLHLRLYRPLRRTCFPHRYWPKIGIDSAFTMLARRVGLGAIRRDADNMLNT